LPLSEVDFRKSTSLILTLDASWSVPSIFSFHFFISSSSLPLRTV
jgi:hypothetical protein